MREFPLECIVDDGSRIPIWPSRTLGAETTGDAIRVWFLDRDDEVANVFFDDEARYVRDALGLADPEDLKD